MNVSLNIKQCVLLLKLTRDKNKLNDSVTHTLLLLLVYSVTHQVARADFVDVIDEAPIYDDDLTISQDKIEKLIAPVQPTHDRISVNPDGTHAMISNDDFSYCYRLGPDRIEEISGCRLVPDDPGPNVLGFYLLFTLGWSAIYQAKGFDVPPNANPDFFIIDEDSILFSANVLANDTDFDSHDSLRLVRFDDRLTMGDITDNGDGTFDYNPHPVFDYLSVDETAEDTLQYLVEDRYGNTDIGEVSITVVGVNDPPMAVDDLFDTDENSVFLAGNVLDNDSDVDQSDTIFVTPGSAGIITTSFIGIPGATQGNVVNLGDGSFLYDPNGQFEFLDVGEIDYDTFQYVLSDNNGATDIGTVTIRIAGVEDPPLAVDDVGPDFSVLEEQGGENTMALLPNVLDNDSDPENDPLTVVSFDDSGTIGIVNHVGGGFFTYDPNHQFELALGEFAFDSFTYTISDGSLTDTATVTVLIRGVNDDPIAFNDGPGLNYSTNSNTSLITGNVLANDFDPESQTLTVTDLDVTSLSTQGSVVYNGNGTFTYDPQGIFPSGGTDYFRYTISDPHGATSTAIVAIEIAQMYAVDAVFANNFGQPTTVFLNDGSGTLTLNASLNPTISAADVEVADLNGDGLLDIYVAHFNVDNDQVFINNLASPGTFTELFQSSPLTQTWNIVLGDLDGDGTSDVLNTSSSRNAIIQLNTANTGDMTIGQTIPGSIGLGADLADIDGDGDLDAFIVGFSDNVFRNDGAGNFTYEISPTSVNADSNGVEFADLDGDGDLDAIVVNAFAQNEVLLNTTASPGAAISFVTNQLFGSTLEEHNDLDLGDFDNDGDIDVFIASRNSVDSFYANDGSGNFSLVGTTTIDEDSTDVELADFDGDGYLDAIVATGFDNTPSRLWMNDGAGNFNVLAQNVGNTFDFSEAVAVGDFDLF